MLKAKGISKRFKRQVVLDNAGLEVDSEIKALVGINGSGKSTFLKILAGIIPCDSGMVTICDRDVTSLPPERRNLGYVPQHPALFRHLSIKENVMYGMRNNQGSIAAYERVVEMLDLGEVLHKRPRELSGGFQNRVSLARALIPEPGIILMDEPLNGMDVVLKERILPIFRAVLKELKVSVLYVTHDPNEAALFADSFAIMDTGAVRAAGSAEEAFTMIRSTMLRSCDRE